MDLKGIFFETVAWPRFWLTTWTYTNYVWCFEWKRCWGKNHHTEFWWSSYCIVFVSVSLSSFYVKVLLCDFIKYMRQLTWLKFTFKKIKNIIRAKKYISQLLSLVLRLPLQFLLCDLPSSFYVLPLPILKLLVFDIDLRPFVNHKSVLQIYNDSCNCCFQLLFSCW